MSDITRNTISAPELGSPSYGDNIQTQFGNIDKNFKQIVEGEYLKGQSGDLVMLEEINLNSNSDICVEFYRFLGSLFNGEDVENGIGNENPSINSSKLYMIYTFNQENGEKEYKTSLPYTFLDPRFNPVTTNTPKTKEDKSCIIVYNGIEFVSYKAFPNIYFNDDLNEFCWKINNIETSLVAQGPKGDKGDKGQVYIMVVTEDLGNGVYQLSFLDNSDMSITPEMHDCMAFIYHNKEGHIAKMTVRLEETTGDYIATAILNEDTNLYTIFANNSLKDVLEEVTPDADLNSIFIPIASDENNDILAHAITTQLIGDKLDNKKDEDDTNTVIISPALIKDKGRDLVSSEGYTLYNNYPTICSQSMWIKRLQTPSVTTSNVLLQGSDSYIRLNRWRFKSSYDEDSLDNLYLDCMNYRESGNLFVNNEKMASQNYVKNIIRDEGNKIENDIYTFLTGEISGSEMSDESLNTKHAVRLETSGVGPLIQIYNSSQVRQESYAPSKDTDIKLGIVLDLSSSKNFIYNLKFSKKFEISLAQGATANYLSQIPFHLMVIDANGHKFEVKLTNLCAYQFKFTNTEIIPGNGFISITKDSSSYPLDLYTQQLICEISINVDFNNKKSTITFNHRDGVANSFEAVATYNEELQSIS